MSWTHHEDGEVPGDDLADDSDGLVAGVGHLGVVDLNHLAVVLVGPSTVVCEPGDESALPRKTPRDPARRTAKAGSGLGDVESTSEGVGLAVVCRKGGQQALGAWVSAKDRKSVV